MRRNSFYFKAKLQNGKYTVGQKIRNIEPAGWAAPVTDEQMWEYPEMQEEETATVTQNTPPPPTPVDLGRESWPAGLHPGSPIAAMQKWCKEKKIPHYGTKQQLWRRMVPHNYQLLRDQAVEAELQRRLEERRQGMPEHPAVQLPEVK